MAKNGNLTSDLWEAISKISEVGRPIAGSADFKDVWRIINIEPWSSTDNIPTVNSEVGDPQSIAPSRNVNHELRGLFVTPRRSNTQASPSWCHENSELRPQTLIWPHEVTLWQHLTCSLEISPTLICFWPPLVRISLKWLIIAQKIAF